MVELSTGVAGLVGGGAYALLGLCTLLTYRLVSVVNFTQTAVGAIGATVMAIMWDDGVPLALAVVVGLAAGAAASGVIGFAMTRYFAEGTDEVRAGVTVVLFTALLGLGGILFGDAHPRNFPDPFSSVAFTVADVDVVWTVVAIIVLAVAFTVLPVVLLRRTRLGLQLRALSSRPTTAQLIGVAAPRLAMIVWLVGGAATALAIMFVAPGVANDYGSLATLITWAFAAALIGAFRSFWGTLLGGLGLGALQGVLSSVQSLAAYRGALPIVVIVLFLVWNQRHARWDAAA